MTVAGASRHVRGSIQTIGAILATPATLHAALAAQLGTPAHSPETIKGFGQPRAHSGDGRRHGRADVLVLMYRRRDVGT